jgi:uncharacterized protein
MDNNADIIVSTLLRSFPDTQAIYLFGSYGTPYERYDSDIDIGLLLPPAQAKNSEKQVYEARRVLEQVLPRSIDLINLRCVSIILQNEVVSGGRLIYCRNELEKDSYEMYALSLLQKYQEETAGIVEEIMASGRVLA